MQFFLGGGQEYYSSTLKFHSQSCPPHSLTCSTASGSLEFQVINSKLVLMRISNVAIDKAR